MKTFLTLLFFLTGKLLSAQTVVLGGTLEEHHFFYRDSACGGMIYGNYEPKDMVALRDGSLVIGTEFSIHYPCMYTSSTTFDSTSRARYWELSKKLHISSGSVFKLNDRFEKIWECIFKDQRVCRVFKTTDERLLVVGEHVSMDFVWAAELDQDGKKLWEKHYKYKHRISIADAVIDEKNAVYLFLEASRMIPIQYLKKRPFQKAHFRFFREDENNTHLAILKITPGGKRIRRTAIETNKNRWKYGYQVVTSESAVFASYTFLEFKKGKRIEGEKIVQLSKKGKIRQVTDVEKQDLLFCKDGLVSITSYSEGDLNLYRSGEKTDSIHVESPRRDVRIERSFNDHGTTLILGSSHDNNRDYLLIKLNPDLTFAGYWTYQREEYNEIRAAAIRSDGQLFIVGKCYREAEGGLEAYTNLVKVNPF